MKNRILYYLLFAVVAMIIVITWNLYTNDIKKEVSIRPTHLAGFDLTT